MGAAMNLEAALFTANKFEKCDQGRVRGNGLPFAHDTLRIDNFTREHGAAVHGELQNVHHLFAAIHFHVRACGNVVSAALRLLWRSVIKQAPKRSDGAISFDGAVVDINNAGIGGGHFLPFSVGRIGHKKHPQSGRNGYGSMQIAQKLASNSWVFQILGNGIHTLYYKVLQRQ